VVGLAAAGSARVAFSPREAKRRQVGEKQMIKAEPDLTAV
jgi:hypothetical protein